MMMIREGMRKTFSAVRILSAAAAPAILYGPVAGRVCARLLALEEIQLATQWWAVGLGALMLCAIAWGVRSSVVVGSRCSGGSSSNGGGDVNNNNNTNHWDRGRDVYSNLCLGPALLLAHRSLGIPLDAVVLGMLPVIGITGCFARFPGGRRGGRCRCLNDNKNNNNNEGGCGAHSASAGAILDVLGCLQIVAAAALMPRFFFFSRWDRVDAFSRWCDPAVVEAAAVGLVDVTQTTTTITTTVGRAGDIVWAVLWLLAYAMVVARFVVVATPGMALAGQGSGAKGRAAPGPMMMRGRGAATTTTTAPALWWAVAALVRLMAVLGATMLGEHIILSLGVSGILFGCFCGCSSSSEEGEDDREDDQEAEHGYGGDGGRDSTNHNQEERANARDAFGGNLGINNNNNGVGEDEHDQGGGGGGGGEHEEAMVPERILLASMVGLLGIVFAGTVAADQGGGEEAACGGRRSALSGGLLADAGIWPMMLGGYVVLFELLWWGDDNGGGAEGEQRG